MLSRLVHGVGSARKEQVEVEVRVVLAALKSGEGRCGRLERPRSDGEGTRGRRREYKRRLDLDVGEASERPGRCRW